MRFQNKNVLVVGASGGIGQRLVKAFFAQGANVFATFNNKALSIPDPAVKIRLEVRDDSEVRKAFEILQDIDIVVYAAGLVANAKIEKMGIGQWNQVIQTNLNGVFSVIKNIIPKMSEDGRIIILGSIVGEIGGYGCANYAASKAGLRGLCKAAANELISKKIYVNLLELGYFEIGMGTEFTSELKEKIKKTIPLGEFGNPEEIVKAVFFLSETKYMTGNVIKIAGGL